MPGMRLLDRGKNAEAVAFFQEYVADLPDDPEGYFGLAAALSRLGKLEGPMAAVRKAVEAGLPAERFVAGPRHLFEALVATEAFQAFYEEHGSPLVHGPMLGCVSDTAARFWVRTARPSEVQVVVSAESPAKEPIRSPAVRTKEATDFTAVAAVKGLKPDTRYTYQVLVDGKPGLGAELPVFRTFPPAGGPGKFAVAFGGGAGYVPPHERMWDTIRERDPRALLLLGDNVYIDHPKSELIQRYCYYRRQSRPEFRRLTAAAAVYAIYDDHDFGTNDCVPGPEADEPAWKLEVWRVFRQNWNNPGYGGGIEMLPGCWFDFAVADVHFILLDGRYYRSNPRKPKASMLGPSQKQWLLERLAGSKATFKVLCSPVPWASGTKPGSLDTWDGFPEEREEILAFIERHRIGGVFLLSADRHRSDVWKLEREVGYPLYEFESSRLTNQHRHGSIPKALFSFNARQSFGLLEFDTTKADPTVTYRILDIDGEEVHAFTLARSQLTPRP
ncbi:MAG: alkaline phosphatase D family protein [Candidatus Brocadiia bacterium]